MPPSSSTPTSSGVTPPTGSSPSVSPVTPPSSGGTVTTLGYKMLNGNCRWFEKLTESSCEPNASDLQIRAQELEDEIKDSAGRPPQEQAALAFDLAKVLAWRSDLLYPGGSPSRRASVEAMANAPAYKNLSPERKLAFWTVLDRGMMTGKTGRADLANLAGAMWGIGQNKDVLAKYPELRSPMPTGNGSNSYNSSLAAFGATFIIGAGGTATLNFSQVALSVNPEALTCLFIVATAYVGFQAGRGIATVIQGVLRSEEVKKIETGVEDKKKIEDYLGGASPVKVGDKAEQREKLGGQAQADKDFENLVDPGSIRDLPGGVRIGTTPSGQTVVLRPSNEGSPTIEIPGTGPDGKPIKVRYR